MGRINAMGEKLKQRGCALGTQMLLGALLLAGASCATLPGQVDSATSRDLLEIKDQLNRLTSQAEQDSKKQNYQVSTLNDTVTNKVDALQNSVDNALQQIQTQQADLQNMKAQLEGIDFAVRKLSSGGSALAPTPSPLQPAPGNALAPAPTQGAEAQPAQPAPAAAQAAQSAQSSPAREAYNNAQSLLQQRKYREAAEGFNQALALNPDDELKADIMSSMAESQLGMNDLRQARATYEGLINLNRESPRAWSAVERLADLDLKENNTKDALYKLQMIEKNYPQYNNIARVKATIARLQGQ